MTTFLKSLCLIAVLTSGCASAPAPSNPWKEITTATPTRSPEAIGTYDAGCLQGAVSLDADGDGYVVMRPSRRRYYGHPTLIDFITAAGREVKKKKLGSMLIGDLSQPRGGPLFPGHASHQIGLDVDVWFLQPQDATKLNLDERENFSAKSTVNAEGTALDAALFTRRNEQILKIAAENPSVDRIFVDALIKKNLCKGFHGQAWLSKLRPWWNHQDHFHVRLKCPSGASQCKNQNAIAPGDGCDATLDWWFSDEAKKLTAEKKQAKPVEFKLPVLPEACEKLRAEN